MTLTTLRSIAIGAVSIGVLTLAAVPASADTGAGSGSVGSSSGMVDGHSIAIPELASCAVGVTPSATTSGADAGGLVKFGSGQSTCGVDPSTGVASVQVTGKQFALYALRAHGGPTIKILSYTVKCNTTENGSQSSIQLSGFSGIQLPNPIPSNYLITVSGQGNPLATITVNEVVTPDPPDGSMTVNLMHVRLLPHGSGEVVVGSASCSPYGDFAA